jgi:hypothetical protein
MPRSARRSQHHKVHAAGGHTSSPMARWRAAARDLFAGACRAAIATGYCSKTSIRRLARPGAISAEPCDGRTYSVDDVAIARLGSATRAGASKPRIDCFTSMSASWRNSDSTSRLRKPVAYHSRTSRWLQALIARCHVADGQNICNAISSMRSASGTVKKTAIRSACNALGKHEIFSEPLVQPRTPQHRKERREQIFPLRQRI